MSKWTHKLHLNPHPIGVYGMIWYLAMEGNCDDDEYCPVGALIFFAALAPIAGLVMYINSLCLRPGFNQIHTN